MTNADSADDDKVRIVLVEGCYDGTVGGSHVCLANLVRNLDRKKFDATVVFYEASHLSDELKAFGIKVEILHRYVPLDLVGTVQGKLGSQKMLLLPFSILQKVINLWSAVARPTLARRAFLKAHGTAIVHLNNSINTNHDWMLGGWLMGAKVVSHERGFSESLSFMARGVSRLVSVFVAVSKTVLRKLEEQGIDESKITLIYDGLDFPRYRINSPRESILDSLDIPPDWTVIGVVGNVKRWKGQETLIRALPHLLKRHSELVCLLLGHFDRSEPYAQHLCRLIEENGLEKHVRIPGFQKNPADYLNAMDIVCHTSIAPEPFGMVNLEAMYLGKPVISTNIGGPTEVIAHMRDGLTISPGDPVELASSIGMLLDQPEFASKLGEEGYRKVIDRFDCKNSAAAVEDIYLHLDR